MAQLKACLQSTGPEFDSQNPHEHMQGWLGGEIVISGDAEKRIPGVGWPSACPTLGHLPASERPQLKTWWKRHLKTDT